MRVTRFMLLSILFSLLVFQKVYAFNISGARLQDIIIAPTDHSDSTFSTMLSDIHWPKGPASFDIDRDGYIYILDQLGLNVKKYDKDGTWIPTFHMALEKSGDDIAVDNHGNIYVLKSFYHLFRYSPHGELDYKIKPNYSILSKYILTDHSGRVYGWTNTSDGVIAVYSPGPVFQGIILRRSNEEVANYDDYEFSDIGIVQKDIGDDIYFRTGGYLAKTSATDYFRSGKIDTVATLPEPLGIWEDMGNYPSILIGFDKNSHFYFYERTDLYEDDTSKSCIVHDILKYHLENSRLKYVGKANIHVEEGEEECSKRELWFFTKKFIVSSDGTIYWLHGTVDTVKVSQIIFDE